MGHAGCIFSMADVPTDPTSNPPLLLLVAIASPTLSEPQQRASSESSKMEGRARMAQAENQSQIGKSTLRGTSINSSIPSFIGCRFTCRFSLTSRAQDSTRSIEESGHFAQLEVRDGAISTSLQKETAGWFWLGAAVSGYDSISESATSAMLRVPLPSGTQR